ncbi:TetR/AcrR family transcriptional regulator [Actinoplanes xinjiangensis]|uniref:TetR/AcrR family transcriptional regulator n=1 Tax=Actinoplanes xinjiangensis TaxID=512350 RepID=UPI00341BFB96
MRTQITSGIVFTVPAGLPRGRHALAREQIVDAQRERMLIAATELLAADGYRGFGVREICARAAVSRAVFYACFTDKDACVFAAYDRFIAVFLDRLAAAGGDDWPGCVRDFVASYLSTLESDLVAARAFGVEMDALGRAARERRRTALTQLAVFVRDLRRRRFPGTGDRVPLSAYLGAIHALRQIAADALDTAPEPDLSALVPELSGWLCRMVEPPCAEETP